MTKQEEICTESTTGEIPWDELFDCSLYTKTQVKMETTIYKVMEQEPLIGDKDA